LAHDLRANALRLSREKPVPTFRIIRSSGMKIATFNINNINRRLPNLLHGCNRPSPTS